MLSEYNSNRTNQTDVKKHKKYPEMNPQEREKYFKKIEKTMKLFSLSLTEAARKFEVPKSTLHDHLKKKSESFTRGRKCALNKEIEKEMVRTMIQSSREDKYRFHKDDIRKFGFEAALNWGNVESFVKKNRKCNNEPKEIAGSKWLTGFIRRNPEVRECIRFAYKSKLD